MSHRSFLPACGSFLAACGSVLVAYGSVLVACALAGALVAGSLAPAFAQKSNLPPAVLKITPETAIIDSQIKLALNYAKRALEKYEALGELDSLEFAHQDASNCYVLLRVAREGMIMRKESKRRGVDPVLDIALKKLDDAWNISRAPVERLSWGQSRQEYLKLSVNHMGRTIALLEQLVLIFP